MENLKRAFLPEVLLLPDVALALRVSLGEARQMLLAHELGNPFTIGGQVGVLRRNFLAALERRAKLA